MNTRHNSAQKTMSQSLHLILGTGPVGCWTARALIEEGHRVRAVNRSGQRPSLMPAEVEVLAADISQPQAAREVAADAAAIYQALNPPYHLWAEEFPNLQANALVAAKAVGARYVSIENLYPYDPAFPMNEAAPFGPRSKKGELRARLAQDVMTAHQRGEVRAAALRSSDYYGPGVVLSAFGERVFAPLLKGGRAQILGSAHSPHSLAYIEDVGRAAAILGTRDEALGAAWFTPHAPALTQGEMLRLAATAAQQAPRFAVVPPWLLRLVGLFNPAARASVEMMYQFTAPFVVDTRLFEQRFGLAPTAIDTGLQRTVAWYREHLAQ